MKGYIFLFLAFGSAWHIIFLISNAKLIKKKKTNKHHYILRSGMNYLFLGLLKQPLCWRPGPQS